MRARNNNHTNECAVYLKILNLKIAINHTLEARTNFKVTTFSTTTTKKCKLISGIKLKAMFHIS
jgi:hypothetical protein